MAHYQKFEDLEIYKMARAQCYRIWILMNETSLSKDFKLRDQISGSSGSVMDNIAEGFGRGSNHETKAQLQRALDRNHISKIEYEDLEDKLEELNQQISKFMNYLKTSERKGSKYD
ncbi:four helix bundle protein [Christiangramia sediminis]|uniref:Four helix bundle protein n=1 Tax=Christiangramia sediminis TaxID=2881336 RepID=A0A9X1LKE3_9FLAO|nr:four helix bundle protein [Christiangramia sediminis]MCB7481996.1 four helix bundle protein [Christiangramia sediminis]